MQVVISDRFTGSIYFEDTAKKIFFIGDIAMGAKILKAFPNETVSLKVIFNEKVDDWKRDLLTTSMVESCSEVISLHLDGFTYDNFHVDASTYENFQAAAFGKKESPYRFKQIVPNLKYLILEATHMPLSQLKELKGILDLSIIRPPPDFLHYFYSDLVELPNMIRLNVVFDKIPQTLSFKFPFRKNNLHFPISMDSVQTLDISESINSNMTALDVTSLSKKWRNVKKLRINVKVAFSIENLVALFKHMPVVEHINAVTLQENVKPFDFISCICNHHVRKLKMFRMRGFGMRERRADLYKFLQEVQSYLPGTCGRIFYPEKNHLNQFQEEPYFISHRYGNRR